MKVSHDDNEHDDRIMTGQLIFSYREMGGMDEDMVWQPCNNISIHRQGAILTENVVEAKQIPIEKERPDNQFSYDMFTVQEAVG